MRQPVKIRERVVLYQLQILLDSLNLIIELSENLIVILNLSQSLLNAEVELDLRLGTRWVFLQLQL